MPHGMDPLLFLAAIEPGYIIAALFLAGLSIFYGLQIRHHRRMEKLAGELFKLKDLREELAALKQAPVKMESEPIQGALEEIRSILKRLEQQMDLQSHAAPEEGPDENEMSLGKRIEMRLESQGFQKVGIVGDMNGAEEDLEGEYRLSLEAYRDGVAYKGYVTVSGGRIVEEMVKPAYEAFP